MTPHFSGTQNCGISIPMTINHLSAVWRTQNSES
jgi:hypothetical protein